MKKTLLLAALLATVAHADPITCKEGRDCERMWLRAMDAAEVASGMRIQFVTDNRIQTYPPSTYGTLGATVTRELTSTGYEIKLRLECYMRKGCENMIESSRKLFEIQTRGVPE